MRSAAPQRDWGIGWPHGILEGPQRAASAGGRHGDPQLRPGTKNVRRRRNGHLAVHPPVGIQRHPVRLCVGVLHLKALGEPGIETRMLQVVPAGLDIGFLSIRTDLGEIDLHHGLGRSRLGPEVEVPGAGHHRVGSESAGGIRQQVTLGGLFPLGVQSRDRLLKRGAVRVRGHDRAGPRFGDVTICGIDRGRGRLQRAVPGEVPGGCRRLRRWERRQVPAGALTGGALWAGGCPRLDQHLHRGLGLVRRQRSGKVAGLERIEAVGAKPPSDAELVLEHPWGEVPHQIRNHGDLTLHIERQEVVPVGGHHGAVAVGMMTVEQLEAGDGCSGELIQQITEPAPGLLVLVTTRQIHRNVDLGHQALQKPSVQSIGEVLQRPTKLLEVQVLGSYPLVVGADGVALSNPLTIPALSAGLGLPVTLCQPLLGESVVVHPTRPLLPPRPVDDRHRTDRLQAGRLGGRHVQLADSGVGQPDHAHLVVGHPVLRSDRLDRVVAVGHLGRVEHVEHAARAARAPHVHANRGEAKEPGDAGARLWVRRP